MQYMPRLSELTLFILVGNEAAMLAGNVVTSIQDHVGTSYQAAATCFALVDETFDAKHVAAEEAFYPVPSPEQMVSIAVQVADTKIRAMIDKLNELDLHDRVSLNRRNIVLVADTNGSVPFDDLHALVAALAQHGENSNTVCDFQLCLLTDYGKAAQQAAWLLKDGQADSRLDVFKKVLLLTNKTLDGNIGTGVEQRMRDAVLPALLMMLDPNQQSTPTRLYSAGYNKEGGTSNDISELKRHIASKVLDGIFANPAAVSPTDVWKWLSTPEISFAAGNPSAPL